VRTSFLLLAVAVAHVCVLWTGSAVTASPLVLAEKGSAKALILMPASPSSVEKYAAEHMANCLAKICGGTFKVVVQTGAPKDSYRQPVISIGRTTLAKDLPMQGLEWKRSNREAFRVVRRGSALMICGNQKSDVCDNGTLWGVHAFLRAQGVGSYLGDPLGDVVPAKPTLTVDEMDFTDAPAFEIRNSGETAASHLRRYAPGGDLVKYLPEGRGDDLARGIAAGGRKVEFFHMYQYLVTPQVRKDHPEWFANTHNPLHGAPASIETGICLSNPGIRNLFVEYFRRKFREEPDLYAASICPDDYSLGDRCSCPNCQRLMEMSAPPTFADDSPRSASDLSIDFVNAVATGLEKEFPDRRLITYAYLDYLDPPTKIRVHPNVIIMIAPLRSPDEIHPALDEIVRGWRRMGAQKLYWYGYLLTRPPVPHLMAEWFRSYKRWGIEGVYLETSSGVGAFSALNGWLASKLMWDPDADVGKLVDEFCAQLFGPDVGILMSRFFIAWDAKPPFASEDIPKLLAAAEKMAGDPGSVLGKRVRLFKLAYELWRSSYDLDEALKLNDISAAHQIVKSGIAAAESLRREYPGWALNQNVAMLNRTGWCEYTASILAALETLLNQPVAAPAPETPAAGPALCLTNNSDLPQTRRIDAGAKVTYSPPTANDPEGKKLFDGKTDGAHAVFNGQYPSCNVDLDLQKQYQIDRVEVCTGMTIGHGHLMPIQTVPIYIEIQVSKDGKDFKPVDRIMPRTLRGFVHSGSLWVTARYVRLVTTSLNWGHEVDEVRIWGRAKPE